MPRSHGLDTSSLVSTVRRMLETLTRETAENPEIVAALERELEALMANPVYAAGMLQSDRDLWLAAASVRQGRSMIFQCFCCWGMPIERVMSLLMTLRPGFAIPKAWGKSYIDTFTDVCAYHWKAAPLSAHLAQFEMRDRIPSVSLKILLKAAYRKKQLEDLLLALRVHMPEMNARLEQALGWLLDELPASPNSLKTLSLELFSPHLLRASYLMAQANPETRQLLWGTPLTYESRVELGKMPLDWRKGPEAEQLGWCSLQDVYATMRSRCRHEGLERVSATLKDKSQFNAMLRVVLIQEHVTTEHALAELPVSLVGALISEKYLEATLVDQRYRELGPVPNPNLEKANIGTNIDTVV